jgi:hypothetical protein
MPVTPGRNTVMRSSRPQMAYIVTIQDFQTGLNSNAKIRQIPWSRQARESLIKFSLSTRHVDIVAP